MHILKLVPLATLLCCAIGQAQPLPPDVDREFADQVERLTQRRGSDTYLADRVKRAYDRRFRDFKPVSKQDYSSKMRALLLTTFYSADREYGADLFALFGEYERRFPVQQSAAMEMFDALVGLRMFAQANTIASKYTLDVERFKLPEGDGDDQVKAPSGWRVDADGALHRADVDVSGRLTILVTAHPSCHFARNALADIEADPRLSRALLPHMRWMVPPGAAFKPSQIVEWNKAHPFARLLIANGAETVPEVSVWGTPTFYIFRDRHLVAMQSGWRGASSLKNLRRAFE